MTEIFKPIHKHLLIKGTVLLPFTDEDTAKKFLVDLVKLIGMNPVTAPQAVYVYESGNEGFTGSINLATSHIAFHIWDDTGLLMMDVYSCKEFDEGTVFKFINERLVLDEASYVLFDRITMRDIEPGE